MLIMVVLYLAGSGVDLEARECSVVCTNPRNFLQFRADSSLTLPCGACISMEYFYYTRELEGVPLLNQV